MAAIQPQHEFIEKLVDFPHLLRTDRGMWKCDVEFDCFNGPSSPSPLAKNKHPMDPAFVILAGT
jgi:hypothetical protein